MLQLRNHTPFVARLLILPNADGIESAVVVVQGTFRLSAGEGDRLRDTQAPLIEADAYVGEPGASPLREASDLTLAKPGTDVLLEGAAHAPHGRAAATFCASFAVGPLHKTVRVLGSREWQRTWVGMRTTDPVPVLSVPLSWAEALAHAPTLPGKNAQLPRLEHPDRPVLRQRRRPPPWGGCGPIPPAWSPRREHAGTYDQTWQRERAPFLPLDFSPHFLHVAPPDQVTATPLCGGEQIALVNCRASGDLQTTVPRCALTVVCRVSGSEQRPPLHLDTVRLLPDADEIRLVWRAVLPLGRRVLELQQVEVTHG